MTESGHPAPHFEKFIPLQDQRISQKCCWQSGTKFLKEKNLVLQLDSFAPLLLLNRAGLYFFLFLTEFSNRLYLIAKEVRINRAGVQSFFL